MVENASVDPIEQTKMRWMEREQQIEAEFKEKTKFHPQINQASRHLKRGIKDLDEDSKRRIEISHQI